MPHFRKLPIFRAIDSHLPRQVANPYRQILRRHIPEPVLALLVFLMGVSLWDHHFGVPAGYEQGTSRMALVKSDRDLRLAEATDHLPALLRAALGIPDRETALESAVAGLDALAREGAIDLEGAYALGVLRSLRDGQNPLQGDFGSLGLPGPPDPGVVHARIEEGSDRWWDREFLKRTGLLNPSQAALHLGTAEGDPRNRELALRAILARGAVALLALTGLAYLPTVFRSFGRALKSHPRGYPGGWSSGLGLFVFLLAYLASIGFGTLLDFALWQGGGDTAEVRLSPQWYALLDAVTRFLPPLVALAFLFRRGRHAVSRLGLIRRPEGGLVLGTFALLTLVDHLLKRTVGEAVAPDPAGGLSPLEAGPWGLALALTSACLAAPLAEEILYRGVLFRSLANRLRVPAATLVSAAVFAIVHYYNAYGLLSVGILGAACALCFASSGRLATAILLHALYNSAIKIPEWIVYHAAL